MAEPTALTTGNVIEIVGLATAVVGSAIGAVWYAGRTMGRLDTSVDTTNKEVKASREQNTVEHIAIGVRVDEHGRLLVRLAEDERSNQCRIQVLENRDRNDDGHPS